MDKPKFKIGDKVKLKVPDGTKKSAYIINYQNDIGKIGKIESIRRSFYEVVSLDFSNYLHYWELTDEYLEPVDNQLYLL